MILGQKGISALRLLVLLAHAVMRLLWLERGGGLHLVFSTVQDSSMLTSVVSNISASSSLTCNQRCLHLLPIDGHPLARFFIKPKLVAAAHLAAPIVPPVRLRLAICHLLLGLRKRWCRIPAALSLALPAKRAAERSSTLCPPSLWRGLSIRPILRKLALCVQGEPILSLLREWAV